MVGNDVVYREGKRGKVLAALELLIRAGGNFSARVYYPL